MVALQIVWDLVRSYVPVLIHDALPVTDYPSLYHFVRSCVAVDFFYLIFFRYPQFIKLSWQPRQQVPRQAEFLFRPSPSESRWAARLLGVGTLR